MTNTMLAAMIGAWELILILAVIVTPALLAGIVLVIYFLFRKKKAGPAAVPPRIPTSTVRLARRCPQCGTQLKADLPEGLCPACLLQHGIATEAGPETRQPFTPPTLAELSRLFPQLEILGPIGKGGMGAVYKARQPALDRIVALKILAPRPGNELDFASRFSREARALAKLNHPNIVAVYDFGVVSSGPSEPGSTGASQISYFIMEYVDGLNLRQVQQSGKIAPREALEIVPQICAALQYAHDEGIVHRDIKPENVLLDKKGRAKIADFGLAKILGQEPTNFRLTGEKDVMGTPHYMAPEQVERPQEVDHRADIYSLGVVFYELLTGELPLGKFAPPSQKVSVDVRLDDVVLRALEKEPERRYQQANEFKTRVETVASSKATEPNVAPPPIIEEKKLSRAQSITLTVASLLLAAVVCVIGWGVFQMGVFFNALFIFILLMVPVYIALIPWRIFNRTLEFRLWRTPFDRALWKYWGLILNRWLFWLLAASVLKLCIVPAQFSPSTLSTLWIVIYSALGLLMLLELLPGKRIYIGTNLIFTIGSLFMAFQIGKIYLPDHRETIALSFPVRGEWLVVHGGRSALINGHHRLECQRDALDIERIIDGRESTGATTALESYPSWGEQLFAPVAGRVVSAVSDLPDNPVGQMDAAHVAGNHIVIEIDADHYVLMAHLQQNSVSVKVGDVVSAGQPIARCGNSGNTSHPHLHIQVQDHADLFTDGVKTFPILFREVDSQRSGQSITASSPRRNDHLTSTEPRIEPVLLETNKANKPAAESWAPDLTSGQKPDLFQIKQQADDFRAQGQYEEALQRYDWLFNHALEYDKNFQGVRLSSLVTDWVELGRRYPKAKKALLDIRNSGARQLAAGDGYLELFADVVAINRAFEKTDSSYELFKTIRQNDPGLAKQCYFDIEDLLVSKGEYAICAEYMGSPRQRFDSLRRSFDMEMNSAQRMADLRKRTQPLSEENGHTNFFAPPDTSESMRGSAQDHFVNGTRQLIEILVGMNRFDEAKDIQESALQTFSNKRISSAVSDACTKLGTVEPHEAASTASIETHLAIATNTLINPRPQMSAAELAARMEAAKSILAFPERDKAYAAIAKDTAAIGNVELTKKAVAEITAFPTRDAAARSAAKTLALNGNRAGALEIAQTITAFTTRDEVLRELAGQ